MKINILYLGRRGGGARFTYDLTHELVDSGFTVKLFLSRNVHFRHNFPADVTYLPVPKNPVAIFLLRSIYLKKTLKIILNTINPNEKIVVVMQHYWQNHISEILSSRGNYLVHIVHDAKRHKGDIWPSNRTLREYANLGNLNLYLSKYVKDQFNSSNSKNSKICEFPFSRINKKDLDKFYDVGVLGRQRKYKNWKLTKRVVLNLPKDIKILVSGHNKTFSGLKRRSNIQFIDKWLNDDVFESYMESCKVLLCLHMNASQSGLIAMAKNLGTYVISTGVGGMSEQVFDRSIGVISESDPDKITEAILVALTNFKPSSAIKQKYEKISTILYEIENK